MNNQTELKPDEPKPEFLICSQCGAKIKNDDNAFKAHLEARHGITGLKPRIARKFFVPVLEQKQEKLSASEVKPQRKEHTFLICKHCFVEVADKPKCLRKHLAKHHNIQVKEKHAQKLLKHFCHECDVEKVKRALARQEAKVARANKQKARIAEKKRIARIRKRQEIEEYRKRRALEDTEVYVKPFTCGEVVNGAPFVRFISAAMGGSNKRY